MASRSSTRAWAMAAVLACAAAPAAAQVRVGPLVGYSLLERTDTSLSHGPLNDAATVGRSWLLGGLLDARLSDHDVVSLEFMYGPFHNDVERYCIDSVPSGTCEPQVGKRVSHALIAALQYSRVFGRSSWRPYLGGGFGLKQYAFVQGDYYSSQPKSTSAAVLLTGGVRRAGRVPVRVEGTALIVPRNAMINDHTQFELQARLVVLPF